MNRKQFLAAGAGGMVLLWLQACGGGDDAGNGNGGFPPVLTSCGASTITFNHGHAVAVPLADLNSTEAKRYSIRGTADHDHEITLTVTQLQALKAGASSVMVTSTMSTSAADGQHSHQVTITCV